MQESVLIAKVKKHDRATQKQFYHANVRLVSHIAKRYVNDTENARDVVQNTFIRVFNKIDQYDEHKGSVKSWISRIAINESIALIRKHHKFQVSPIENLSEFNEPAMNDNVFARLELEEVELVIQTLPDEYRIILDLHFYEEYSHKEISELLDISVQSSRVKLHRAKKAFYWEWVKTTGNGIQRII